jgi:hypothetical protein
VALKILEVLDATADFQADPVDADEEDMILGLGRS